MGEGFLGAESSIVDADSGLVFFLMLIDLVNNTLY